MKMTSKWRLPQKWRRPKQMKMSKKMKTSQKRRKLKNGDNNFLWMMLALKRLLHTDVVYVNLHYFFCFLLRTSVIVSLSFGFLFEYNILTQKIVTTPTQPQLNSTVGCDTKMILIHHPPPTHTNSMSAISQLLLIRFQPNFKFRFLGWTTTTITITTTTPTTVTTTTLTTSHLWMTWF